MEGLSGKSGLDARSLYQSRFDEWRRNPATKDKTLTSDINKASRNFANFEMQNSRQRAKDWLDQENAKHPTIGRQILNGLSNIGSAGKTVLKGYGAIGELIPTKQGAENGTEQVVSSAIDSVGKIVSKTPIGAAWYTTYKLGSQFGLNGTATDFNDKENGLTFAENLGNTLTKPIPFIGALGTSVEKNDRSRLAGSHMYSWEGNIDKYGQVGNGSNKFNVLFGGSKIAEGGRKDKININTAVGIRDQGNRDILGAADVFKEQQKLNSQIQQGGWDYINPDSRIYAKQGSILQFGKRALSKHKIKKQQSDKPEEVITQEPNNEQVDSFKEGGKVNVIPSGALHAHKHNLTEIAEDGEKFEDVTTKGIPVVVEDEKGNLIQQAEVEREEIIFRLEVTKKLEELSKEHTDEAAIEAGKLLVKEILYNTEDNTGEML